MSDLDLFRQGFAGILDRCARDRRASLCGGAATGEDLRIIALFERLARDAETLDPAVFARCRASAAEGLDPRCFAPRREALLAQVGILYWPKDAADLIDWIGRQLTAALDMERPAGPAMPPLSRRPRRAASAPLREARGFVGSWAGDFSAGLGIVAPLLSLWNIRAAFGQMHDRAFVADHTSVPASVVSVSAVTASRSSGSASDVVLEFRQPSGQTCRATWHTGIPAFSGRAGDTLAVVPRSPACELPLIPTALGDPLQSFALAAALMAGGLASVKMWLWLSRRSPRRVARPMWFAPGARRHDLA